MDLADRLGIACTMQEKTSLDPAGDSMGARALKTEAEANPAQLTAGLLNAALACKARLVLPVKVTDMAELPGGVALATSDGLVIAAGHAEFCTGYEYLRQMKTPNHLVSAPNRQPARLDAMHHRGRPRTPICISAPIRPAAIFRFR